jgi:aminoglycoside 3-N-acetyltransferase
MTGRRQPVDRRDLDHAVMTAGLAGRPVVVHSSLSSFGWVNGGAAAVVDALLDRGCTVVVPTFSYGCEVRGPAGMRLERNTEPSEVPETPLGFSPVMTSVSPEMGKVPAWIAAHSQRHRGNHPLNSFAALGPLAEPIIGGQTPSEVYAPLEVVCGLGGAVALLGVDLTSMTLLHLAEHRAGRQLFVRWARLASGPDAAARTGSCSGGFEQLAGRLAAAETTLIVGSSRWRIFEAARVLEIASEAIRQDPQVTACADPRCGRCRAAIAGGPLDTDRLFA